MAKSRKKKRVKDFAKVKLKVGKKLNKDNQTKAEVKAKRLVLLGQLTKAGGDAAATAQSGVTDIKELLSQLGHYKLAVKKAALLRLKDWLSSSGFSSSLTCSPAASLSSSPSAGNAGLVCQLGTLIENLFPLLMDAEGDVRRTAARALEVVFNEVPTSSLAPHFALITAHMTCAFTHVSQQVKLDAVKVFHALMTLHPEVIQQNQAMAKAYIDLFVFSNDANATASGEASSSGAALFIGFGKMLHQSQRYGLLRCLVALFGIACRSMKCRTSRKQNAPNIKISYDSETSDLVALREYPCGDSPDNWLSSLSSSLFYPLCARPDSVYSSNSFDMPSNLLPMLRPMFSVLTSYWTEVTSHDEQLARGGAVSIGYSSHQLEEMLCILQIYAFMAWIYGNSEPRDATLHPFRAKDKNWQTVTFRRLYVTIFPCTRRSRTAEDAKGGEGTPDLCTVVNLWLCRFVKQYEQLSDCRCTSDDWKEYIVGAITGQHLRPETRCLAIETLYEICLPIAELFRDVYDIFMYPRASMMVKQMLLQLLDQLSQTDKGRSSLVESAVPKEFLDALLSTSRSAATVGKAGILQQVLSFLNCIPVLTKVLNPADVIAKDFLKLYLENIQLLDSEAQRLVVGTFRSCAPFTKDIWKLVFRLKTIPECSSAFYRFCVESFVSRHIEDDVQLTPTQSDDLLDFVLSHFVPDDVANDQRSMAGNVARTLCFSGKVIVEPVLPHFSQTLLFSRMLASLLKQSPFRVSYSRVIMLTFCSRLDGVSSLSLHRLSVLLPILSFSVSLVADGLLRNLAPVYLSVVFAMLQQFVDRSSDSNEQRWVNWLVSADCLCSVGVEAVFQSMSTALRTVEPAQQQVLSSLLQQLKTIPSGALSQENKHWFYRLTEVSEKYLDECWQETVTSPLRRFVSVN